MNTVLWTALFLISGTMMGRYTNVRIARLGDETERPEPMPRPYRVDWKTCLVFLGFTILTAVMAFHFAEKYNSWFSAVGLAVCYVGAFAAAIIDLKLRIIPNIIPLTIIAVRLLLLIYEFVHDEMAIYSLLNSILGGGACLLVLLIADRISKGGIGMGDIKLVSSIGFMCGLFTVISVMVYSMLICAVVAIILVLLKKVTMRDQLPFGPFIYLGFTAMLLLEIFWK